MVDGDTQGAVMGLDVVCLRQASRRRRPWSCPSTRAWTCAGYVARKLIAAEPFLEHGLALALTVVDAVSLRTQRLARN